MIETVIPSSLSNYYSSPSDERYSSLTQKFELKYSAKPDFIARAPGRVNIIGEHIDYEGYGVLPTAIDKDCLIAFKRVKSETLEISHVMSENFPDAKLSKYPSKIWEGVEHAYTKYFAAGYRAGIFELIDEAKIVGLQILIEGNIPWAAGISSSSAFCVCSALVSNYANRTVNITKEDFVERCIRFEREVGTASGGMDQSISLLGKKNSCLYIQFNPIRAEKVDVPLQNYKLIVMNSLVESAKMETAVYRYNKRVCECRIATHLLAKNLGIPKETYSQWKILKQLQEHLSLNLEEILPVVTKNLPRRNYTQSDLETELEVPVLSIINDIQRAEEVLSSNKEFKLFEAAYHVYSEAGRVLKFIDVCKSNQPINEKVKILGNLMNESQSSCKNLYECSCEEIDELTSLAIENGALGSRLTGAGWGGCTISIIPSEIESEFMNKMKELYYNKPEVQKRNIFGIENAMFATQPSEGAFVVDLLL